MPEFEKNCIGGGVGAYFVVCIFFLNLTNSFIINTKTLH